MTHRGDLLSPDRIRHQISPAGAPTRQPRTGTAGHDVTFAHGVLAVWWLLFLVGTLLQPAADGTNVEALSALDTVITIAAFAVLLAVTALLTRASGGSARGGWAAFGGGLFFLGLSLACPATDHHQIAGWWYGQLGAYAGMAAAGLVAVRYAIRRR